MSLFLDTRGLSTVAIGICDRCKMKVPLARMRSDGNSPGLRVCDKPGCWDHFDPWRLPARRPEDITLRFPRPEEPLIPEPPISIVERLAAAQDTIFLEDQADASVVALFGFGLDAVSFSDSAASIATREAIAGDSLAFSDAAASFAPRLAEASDSVAVSDEGSAIRSVFADADDSLSFSDSAEEGSGDPYYALTQLILRGQGPDGGGTVTDDSPYAYVPLSNVGVTTDDAESLPGFGPTALLFDGTGGVHYAWSNLDPTLSNLRSNIWTFEAWVRPATSGVKGLLSCRNAAPDGWAWTTTGFRARLLNGGWSDTVIVVTEPTVGDWTFLELSNDGTTLRYFSDGVLIGSYTETSPPLDILQFSGTPDIVVGASASNDEQPFQGSLYLRATMGVVRNTTNYTPPSNFPGY